VVRISLILGVAVLLSIGLISGISYYEIVRTTEENSNIRIDRAAKTAAAVIRYGTDLAIDPVSDEAGKPQVLTLTPLYDGPPDLSSNALFDELVLAIGKSNQGAANIFSYSEKTGLFDRIATTFRKPDGGMPPPFSIKPGHSAYANLVSKVPFIGNVPVQGRLRLAYLMPIVDGNSALKGAAAVDVGWADDLTVAQNRLSVRLFTAAALVLFAVIVVGGILLRHQMMPLRRLAAAAHRLASGEPQAIFPCADRPDEIGDLAHGLARVTELQERLHKLAYVDPVTTGGNRTKYFADIADALERAAVGDKKTALIQLDFIGFAKINDTFGQKAGNRVLMQTYTHLRRLLGESAKSRAFQPMTFVFFSRSMKVVSFLLTLQPVSLTSCLCPSNWTKVKSGSIRSLASRFCPKMPTMWKLHTGWPGLL